MDDANQTPEVQGVVKMIVALAESWVAAIDGGRVSIPDVDYFEKYRRYSSKKQLDAANMKACVKWVWDEIGSQLEDELHERARGKNNGNGASETRGGPFA